MNVTNAIIARLITYYMYITSIKCVNNNTKINIYTPWRVKLKVTVSDKQVQTCSLLLVLQKKTLDFLQKMDNIDSSKHGRRRRRTDEAVDPLGVRWLASSGGHGFLLTAERR